MSCKVFTVLILFALSGCSDYHVIKSDVAIPSAASGADPLPLMVGVKVVGQSLSGGFVDMGPAFASRLSNTRLFKTVLHPVKPEDKPDLVIEANFSGRHVGDSSSFAKGFFIGILLLFPALAVEYEDHYISTAAVVITKSGRPLKSYSAGSDVLVESKLFASDADIQRVGVTAATNGVMDRLIAQLSNDRNLFAGR
jgi:hypothetical protein